MTAPVVLPTVEVGPEGSVDITFPGVGAGHTLVFRNITEAQVSLHAALVGLAAAETRYLRSQDPELFT